MRAGPTRLVRLADRRARGAAAADHEGRCATRRSFSRRYVAVDGAEFSIKCSLARPAPRASRTARALYADGATDDDGRRRSPTISSGSGPARRSACAASSRATTRRFGRFGAPRAKGSEDVVGEAAAARRHANGRLHSSPVLQSLSLGRAQGGLDLREALHRRGGRPQGARVERRGRARPKSTDDGLGGARARALVLEPDERACEVRTRRSSTRRLAGCAPSARSSHLRGRRPRARRDAVARDLPGLPARSAARRARRAAPRDRCGLRAIQDGLLERESSRRVLGVELGARAPPAPEAPRGGDDDDDAEARRANSARSRARGPRARDLPHALARGRAARGLTRATKVRPWAARGRT